MYAVIDEDKDVVKTYWQNIRDRVKKVEPTFAAIVDELSPDNNFPLYLFNFPYGALIADTETPYLPLKDGNYIRFTDPNVPKDIQKHLGYGQYHSPFAMVLEKEFEFFIDLKDENLIVPWAMYTPGTFFSYARNLSNKNNRIYAPNGILSATSGARSAYMLPNIGCMTNHVHLQSDLNIKKSAPKTLYDHWFIFKEIVNSEVIKSTWRSCLIYFSENWVNKMHSDSAWLKLKLYLHELAWQFFEYDRSHIYYEMAFSLFQKKRNLKPNPYLTDTAKHLFITALGDAPGYIPAINDSALPIDTLQKVFVESYGLRKYIPTIMQPSHFDYKLDNYPIYYSLQNPSTYVFSPKARSMFSTLIEMRELEHITKIFKEEFMNDNGMCKNTIISEIAKHVRFDFYHNKLDKHNVVDLSSKLVDKDNRFNMAQYKSKEASFARDAPFLRGCVSITKD